MKNIATRFLDTNGPHRIFFEDFGSKSDKPAVFLHGGPGSSCHSGAASLFTAHNLRLIQLDQRGCGQSLPSGDLTENTTAHLVSDLEALRSHLGLDKWGVYGGSWGATLALEYAKAFPHRVDWLLLRGGFLARKQDLDWFTMETGVARHRPEAYAQLLEALGCSPDTLLDTLHAQLHQPERAYDAALAWDRWEAAVMAVPAADAESDPELQRKRIHRKQIYAHYCIHSFFLGEHGVMPELEKIAHIPLVMVHGKQDLVCPIAAAQTLGDTLADAILIEVEAGHGLHEAGIQTGMKQALTLLTGS